MDRTITPAIPVLGPEPVTVPVPESELLAHFSMVEMLEARASNSTREGEIAAKLLEILRAEWGLR